jgi:hypothetical protein
MKRTVCAVLVLTFLGTAAHAGGKQSRIGNFMVETDQDPMSDQTNYFAMTADSAGAVLGLRCLSGQQNLIIAVMAQAQEGAAVVVEARFDSGPVISYPGLVVKSGESSSGIQFGDEDAVAKLGEAHKAAVRLTMADGVQNTYTFALRESARVAAGVKAACAAPRDSAPSN